MLDISICIITKDECEKLKRCLDSLKNISVEIVVVDTGSTDSTIAMLNEYSKSDTKCRIVIGYFKWINDFGVAKNYCASLASNNNICIVDSDEWLACGKLEETSKLVTNCRFSVGRIERINKYERNGEKYENREYISRIYDRRYFEFTGKIHEQLVRKDGDKYIEFINLPIVFNHDGYNGDAMQINEKCDRNIRLLKEALTTEGESPYVLYQIGKSYYMAGDYNQAVNYFDKALYFDVNPKLEYVIDMIETYGYALINSNQAKKALNLEGVYNIFGDSSDFKFMMGFVYMNNNMFQKAISEFLDATKCPEGKMKGTNSFLAYYNAGVIMECLGYTDDAIQLYKKCDGYSKAEARLKEIYDNKN